MDFAEKLTFLVMDHTPRALAAMGLFALGAATAIPVLRARIAWMLAMPERFARLIGWILRRSPSVAGLALFIFAFNAVAIFLYMLTGVIPGLPFAIAFLTGLNVAAAGVIAAGERRESAPPRPFARLCAVLTFLLELPCFWYAIALGSTLTPNIVALVMGADTTEIRKRIVVYVSIIVPVLAVSALAEAYAVTRSSRST